MQHEVEPNGLVRFALTTRYIDPESVDNETDRAKGQFFLTPEQVYDGK